MRRQKSIDKKTGRMKQLKFKKIPLSCLGFFKGAGWNVVKMISGEDPQPRFVVGKLF